MNYRKWIVTATIVLTCLGFWINKPSLINGYIVGAMRWAVWKEIAEGYEKALEKISHPIIAMQEECKKEGTILDGRMAIQLSDDAAYLRSIATKALVLKKQN